MSCNVIAGKIIIKRLKSDIPIVCTHKWISCFSTFMEYVAVHNSAKDFIKLRTTKAENIWSTFPTDEASSLYRLTVAENVPPDRWFSFLVDSSSSAMQSSKSLVCTVTMIASKKLIPDTATHATTAMVYCSSTRTVHFVVVLVVFVKSRICGTNCSTCPSLQADTSIFVTSLNIRTPIMTKYAMIAATNSLSIHFRLACLTFTTSAKRHLRLFCLYRVEDNNAKYMNMTTRNDKL